MAKMIWVKVGDPRGIFYQDILDEVTGEVHAEMVRAETINGRQVPVPMQVEDTNEVRKALYERLAGQPPQGTKTRLVAVDDDELQAYLGGGIDAAVSVPDDTSTKTVSKAKGAGQG